MAKVSKKDKKIQNKENKLRRKYDCKRDCFVNLERLSQKEYEIYSASSQIIVKNFSMAISGDSVQYKGKNHYSKSNTFNFRLKKHLSDLILECCDPVEKSPIQHFAPNEVRKSLAPIEKTAPIDALKSLAPVNNSTPIEVGKSLTALINQSWKKSKIDFKASGRSIDVGNLVMAKMATYSAWPARIDGFTKNKKRAQVFFFGTNNVGSVNTNEIVCFSECYSVIRLLLLRKIGPFHKGIVEIEAIQGIPSELSLTKERLAMQN